jgi:integrase
MKSGWIEKRTGERGVSYRVRYWAPDATGELKPKSKSFGEWAYAGKRGAEQAANAYLAKMLTEVRSGDYLAPVATTLKELVTDYVKQKEGRVSDSTVYVYRAAAKHLTGDLAAMPIQRIRGQHIQAHYAALERSGVGADIIRLLHAVVGGALNQAVRWELVRRNVANTVTPPAARTEPMPYWTPEQTAIFLQLEGDGEPYGLLWSLIVMTGMRSGEAQAIRWTDIHFDRNTLTIMRTVTRGTGGTYRIGDTTKSRNGRRTIPLPSSLVDPLKAHRARQRERRLAASEWHTGDGDLVFTRPDGRPLPYGMVGKAFKLAVISTGLPEIGMHGLRHSYATAMLIAGVHPKTVAELIGDKVATVLRVYSHVTVEARQDASQAFDAKITRLREDLPERVHTTTSEAI